MKSCTHCSSTKFGLVRHRIGTFQFCKKACKVKWHASANGHFRFESETPVPAGNPLRLGR